MLGKTEKNPQLNLTETPLVHFIDPAHELCKMAKRVNWDQVEKDFKVFYSDKGAPSIPIRIMVGLIMLKHVYHQSDKSSLLHWIENPYWQHFCGEVHFQHKVPFYYSDFSHFRKRIGKEGEKKIDKLGAEVFGSDYAKYAEGQGKKGHPLKRSIFARASNRLGNYLIRIASH